MKIETEFPRKIIEYADMGIVMPDGCRLSARVWMPEDAVDSPVPAIIEHLPYRKRDGTIVRDQYTHPWFAGHGYACIRVDMRGNGDSEGLMDDEYTPQELQDACDVITWAAEQPWCSGNIGMMGISWGGFNALQVAALRPPALKAIITICSTVDRFADDIHYKGGCLLNENFGWAANMLSYSSRPPDRALVGDKWRDMWLNRLEHQPYHWSTWMRHQHRDDYWKHGSVCEDYPAIEAAVLSIGGWHDGYRNTVAHLVENISAPVKGIVGPWIHKYPHYAGPKPAIGFLQEAKRWWDRWLKGEETGVESDPAYRAWLMDSIPPKRWVDERPGRWIAEDSWPSQNVDITRLYLGDGMLEPAPDDIDTQICSPQDCGAQSGEYFPFAFADELPDEQSSDDLDSACFDGSVLTEAFDIVGAPVVDLTASADAQNGLIAVRLCDLRPDGTSALITYGVLNLTHRSSHETPEPLVPGEIFTARVTLDQIAYRIPAGHRLRVAVSTAYWPLIWPSPQKTTLTLKGGSLELPVRPPATGDEWQFEPPVGAEPWKANELRAPAYLRSVRTNSETGETSVIIDCDFGEYEDREHGLISNSWTRECWSVQPDDPGSAQAEIEWEKRGGREGETWRTHVTATMHSDPQHFYSKATLRAWENDKLIFERTYDDTVVRNLV
ncbi:CocE/NonD family hydrolase [Hoeflea sp. TYP-13]|uniref:CocE/NonD family hydrolase n=1 Tax=Hoeflea sp. TYP-13 TaxID=3230023 RepID=UPI0034C6A7BD